MFVSFVGSFLKNLPMGGVKISLFLNLFNQRQYSYIVDK